MKHLQLYKSIWLTRILALTILFFGSLDGSSQDKVTPSLKEIMRGYDFIGHSPESLGWSLDSDTLYFKQRTTSDSDLELFAYIPKSDTLLKIPEPESFKVINYSQSNLHRDLTSGVKILEHGGNLYLMPDYQVLMETSNSIRFAEFSSAKSAFFFREGNNYFEFNLETGGVKQINEVRKGKKPAEKNKDDDWISGQEAELIDYIGKQKIRKEKSNERTELRDKILKKRQIYYLDKEEARPLGISTDGRFQYYAVYLPVEAKETMVPSYIRPDGRVGSISGRPKVGSPQRSERILIMDALKDTILFFNFHQLPGVFDKPAFLKEYSDAGSKYNPLFDQPRDLQVGNVFLSSNGNYTVIELFSQDYKDRWIVWYKPEENTFLTIDRQHDDAWIGGPGISSWGSGVSGFFNDKDLFYFQSEVSGYSHLYVYDFQNGEKKALSSGAFEIHQAQPSKEDFFYVKSNMRDPGQYHMSVLDLDGNWVDWSGEDGAYQYAISPDEKHIAALYSFANKPPELYYWPLGSKGERRQLTQSTTVEFNTYPWRVPEFIHFEASDGVSVPARLYRPDDGLSNGAAVIFVHGAGYLQNAHKYWSQYYREYMFHNLLADLGYTILDIDYRASSGYGRDWRTAIYRHMGGRDLEDHIDGAVYLSDSLNIDSGRIGIYGGSYGGFITLMALFKYPGVFKCGAALRSVTDWAHYNHGYTARILNTPETDSIAYTRSSPIYFAEGLEDHLLILHGMVDVNVQFQDVVRLNQRLIELGKEKWTLSMYPVEDHGFTESESWYDEYRRILELFNNHLLNK